jgi:hypothetical protein
MKDTIVGILVIIHHPSFLLKNVAEIELCVHPLVKTYSVGPNQYS